MKPVSQVEEVAEKTPEKITREFINPLLGIQPYEIRKISAALGFQGDEAKQFGKLLRNLFGLFLKCDCSMVEINPLVTTPDGQVLALDAKFGFADNALYRHPEIVAYRDTDEEDPREVAASEYDLNYIGLDGNIPCLVNGAGLAAAPPRSRSPRPSRSSCPMPTCRASSSTFSGASWTAT